MIPEAISKIKARVNRESVMQAGRDLWQRVRQKWIGLVVIAAIFVALFLWLGATAAVFISLFALLYVLRIEGRVAVAAGIMALIVCAIMLLIGSRDHAETWASWAFYLFLAGIALQFIELRRDIRKKAGEAEDNSAPNEQDVEGGTPKED